MKKNVLSPLIRTQKNWKINNQQQKIKNKNKLALIIESR
jgi:hypothetical protein